MWQTILTIIAIIIAVVYASWTLMPQRGRLRIAQGLARVPLVRELAKRLVARESSGGCSACAGSHGAKHPPRVR